MNFSQIPGPFNDLGPGATGASEMPGPTGIPEIDETTGWGRIHEDSVVDYYESQQREHSPHEGIPLNDKARN